MKGLQKPLRRSRDSLIIEEYPPRVVGIIASCAKFLAEGLSRKSVDVYVIAFDDWSVGYAREDGAGIWRIDNPVRVHVNMITWVMTLTQEFLGKAFDLYHGGKAIDLVHAHDWARRSRGYRSKAFARRALHLHRV